MLLYLNLGQAVTSRNIFLDWNHADFLLVEKKLQKIGLEGSKNEQEGNFLSHKLLTGVSGPTLGCHVSSRQTDRREK